MTRSTRRRGRNGMFRIAAVASMVFATALCVAAPGAAAEPRDTTGQPIVHQDATRIVSIGGAITEILYALGLEDRIVAVDTTSTWPEKATSKPQVGYMRALSPEGVLSLDPTVVIAAEGSGPSETIDVLRRSSVPFVLVPDKKSIDGIREKIAAVSKIVGQEEAGAALADAVGKDFALLAEALKGVDTKRRAMFILSMGNGAPVAAGRDTSAEAILGLAGIENALTGFSGFKTVSDEAVIAAAPEAVVVMSERQPDLQPGALFSTPGLAATPAARENRAVSMSGIYLLGFGPRAAHAARDLAAALYPEEAIPALPSHPWTVQK